MKFDFITEKDVFTESYQVSQTVLNKTVLEKELKHKKS